MSCGAAIRERTIFGHRRGRKNAMLSASGRERLFHRAIIMSTLADTAIPGSNGASSRSAELLRDAQ